MNDLEPKPVLVMGATFGAFYTPNAVEGPALNDAASPRFSTEKLWDSMPEWNKEILMSTSAPQIFKNITPERYARLVEKAKTSGIDLSGNGGTASKYGVEIAWNYAPSTQELSLQCLKTPFFMSADVVDAKIATLVKESLS